MISWRRVPAAGWLSASLVLGVTPAVADDPETAPVQVQRREIELRVVHASQRRAHKAPWVDPRLETVRSRLVQRFDYGRYQLLKSVSQSLAVNEKGAVIVSEQHRLEVVPTAFEGGRTRMQVRLIEASPEVKAGDPRRATVEMRAETGRHGTLVIGGVPYRDGHILLIIRQPD